MPRRPDLALRVGDQPPAAQPIGHKNVVFRPVVDEGTKLRRVPIDGTTHDMAPIDRNLLNNLRIVDNLVPKTVGVEKIEHALLAASEQQIPGKQRKARAAQVVIREIELRFVAGSEVVDERQTGAAD